MVVLESAAARGVNADEALPEGPQLPGVVGVASIGPQAVRDDVVGDARRDAPVVKGGGQGVRGTGWPGFRAKRAGLSDSHVTQCDVPGLCA